MSYGSYLIGLLRSQVCLLTISTLKKKWVIIMTNRKNSFLLPVTTQRAQVDHKRLVAAKDTKTT